jgi:hypothetical protein
MLVRVAVQGSMIAELERVLAQGELAEADLTDLQDRLEREASEPLFRIAMRGERAIIHGLFDQLEHNLTARQLQRGMGMVQRGLPGFEWAGKAGLKYNHAAALRFLSRQIEIADLPAQEWMPRWKQLEQETEKKPWLVRLLAKGLPRNSDIYVLNQAKLRCAAAALAMERFRVAKCRWPHTLAELTPQFLKEVPLDPYDGQPLRLVRKQGRMVIYTLGADGQDNGGNLEEKPLEPGSDTGFRLWDVDQRRRNP